MKAGTGATLYHYSPRLVFLAPIQLYIMKSSSTELGVSASRADTPPTLDNLTHDHSQMSRTRRDADTFMTETQPQFEGIFNRPTQCNSAFKGDAGEIYEVNPNPAVNMSELNVPEHQRPHAGLDRYTQLSQSALIPTFVQSIHQDGQMRSVGWTLAYHLEAREGLRNGDWAYSMSGTKNNETGDKQTYTRPE
jgi:hypothetical protein